LTVRLSSAGQAASGPAVVHVSPVTFGEDGHWGGGERYPLELAKAQSEIVPTRLVSFAARGRRERIGNLEVVVLPIQARYRGSHLNPVSTGLLRELHGAQTVHVHQFHSMLTDILLIHGRLARRRIFVTDHGGTAQNLGRLLPRAKLIGRFLAVSRYSASFYPELAARTSVIYGGADTERFRPAAGARRGALFVGRLLPHKGVDVLIGAADPGMEVTIYGRVYDPGYRATLGRLARGKNVTFVEDATDDEIVRAYQSARVLVLPSVLHTQHGPASAKAELLGLVQLEAFACATPVICSDIGPLPEVSVDGETGFVVPAGDRTALADRLRRILSEDGMWQRMSDAALARSRRQFSWTSVAQRTLEIYSDA
jgi:glycosyltransferase involved in cell wall biosynthesis